MFVCVNVYAMSADIVEKFAHTLRLSQRIFFLLYDTMRKKNVEGKLTAASYAVQYYAIRTI